MLDAGELVECVFAYTGPPRILVDVVTEPPGHPQSFEIQSSGDTFTLTDTGEPVVSGALATGTSYSVSGNVPSGWGAPVITCTSSKLAGFGGTPADIVLEHGELVTCEFAYGATQSDIELNVVTAPPGSAQRFPIILQRKQGPAQGFETIQIVSLADDSVPYVERGLGAGTSR